MIFAQTGIQSTWDGNIIKRKVFIENVGQYDKFSNSSIGEVKYAVDCGVLRIFFGEKGISYSYLEATKLSKGERDAIMAKPLDELPHYKKEHLIGKFNIKKDEVNMTWVGSNSLVSMNVENETYDYFSFAVNQPNSEEVINYTNVKGFTTLTYKNIYPFIDVKYKVHEQSGIKYSIILHPGANPDDVKMIYDSEANLVDGKISIPTYFDDIIEHEPLTFYASDENNIISSNFIKTGNVFQFELDNYDSTEEVIIDPWVQAGGFTTSSAIWEVETDGAGNVYVIGGETPMQLKKYNSTGTLQWTYTTPWDTNNVWLGTLATDVNGVSYITSGTSPQIERVTTGGAMVWHNIGPGGIFALTEYWSITFNCDNTKLIVGGTGGGAFSAKSMIYNINTATGNVINDMEVGIGAQGGFTPVEVRAISSSKNAKYIFITHKQVGAINQNIGFCPSQLPIFEVNNGANLGYKCENFLPSTQNGGGLKALIANDLYFYTHAGNTLRQWDLINGTLINSIPIPGGQANNGFGGLVVKNMGLSVDNCGNVYVGSFDRVLKYDQNLNFIAEVLVPFTVYDVSVNANGEVLAVGAQGNNTVTTNGGRNGRIQSVALNACAKFSVICCDANICPAGPFCETDPIYALVTTTPGGTWSGVGVDAFGNFDPSVAGIGNHPITYTLPCGTETIVVSVIACNSPIAICEETNGTLTATGGSGTYSWYTGTVVVTTTNISNAASCTACGGTPVNGGWFGFYNHCEDGFGTTITSCNNSTFTWNAVPYSTATTSPAPSSYPILIIDGAGDSIIINNAGELSACTIIILPAELKSFELTCSGSEVVCDWATNSEKDNDYFVIEKSGSDGIFSRIATIEGSMNSASENYYQWIDPTRDNGVAYYKLSQVDINGNSKHLATRSVNCNDAKVEIFPNPFINEIRIELGDLLLNSNGSIDCFNSIGQLVIHKEIGKISSYVFNTENLSKGVYTIRITSENVNHVAKLIKY